MAATDAPPPAKQEGEEPEEIEATTKKRWFRSLRRVIAFLLIFLVIEYLVLPQIAGVRESLHLVKDANLWFVGAGILLEVLALIAYAELTRAVLPRERTPGLWRVLRIDLSTLAVSHIVPGGSVVGAGLGFRLLTQSGVNGTDAGFALAAQGIGSAVVLNVLLWIGLMLIIPIRGFNPVYGTAAIVGVVLIAIFFALILLLTRGEARAARIFRAVARKVPFLDEDTVHRMVHRIADRLRMLGRDRSLLYRAIGWAAANWILDAASLWAFLAAFGHRVGIDALLVSYGLAQVLAAIPITPGGLGIVEATLTATLVGFGTPRGIAILGVIGYRLFNFWVPIPVGGLAYLSLRAEDLGSGKRNMARIEMRKMAEQLVAERESAKAWAARHGMKVHTKAASDPAPKD